jgi:RNA polymerase sigma-70 factor (ECF subfamily)
MTSQAEERPLDDYREYLRLLARLHLNPRMRKVLESSDLVQDTLMKAHERRAQLRGHSDAEIAGWLRTILANTLADAVRKYTRQQGNQHVSLEAAVERSSARLEAWLAAEAPTPREQALKNEELLRLADALGALPDDQRAALELHHLQGCSVPAICQVMGKSNAAVAGLLRRGLKKLRELLAENC